MHNPVQPRTLTFLLASACALSVANVYYAQPLLDALAADFAISQAAVGAVITATQAGSVLALLLLVPLGDLMPRRKLLLLQLLALAVALLGVACARQTPVLMAAMLLVGMLGTAMTQGLIACAAAIAAPAERGKVVGAAQGGVVTGLLLARVMAGLIADLAGWRAVYGASALAMVATALLLWRTLPALQSPSAAMPYLRLVVSTLTLLRQDRVLRVRSVIALLMFAAFNIMWSALVLPLSAAPYHYSTTTIGAFGLIGLAGALAAASAGRWADQGLGQRTSAAALALLVLAWLPLGLAFGGSEVRTLIMLVIGIVMLDLGVQALQVTNQSMILQGSAAAHARLIGAYMLFYAVGSGAGAMAATAVYSTAGWNGVCLLGGTVSLAALLFWLHAGRHRHIAP